MSVQIADSELKARHRAMWASGDYPPMVETFLLPLGQRLVEACGIGPGMRVLDVAAGTGNASLPAARRGAEVTASDLTPELLEAGRGDRGGRGPRARVGRGRRRAPAVRGRVVRRRHVLDRRRCSRRTTRPPPTSSCASAAPGGTIGLLSWTPEGMLGALFRTMKPFAPAAPARRAAAAAVGQRGAPARAVRRPRGARHARARDARDHRLRAPARLRRALQGLLRADDRRAGERGARRPRAGVRRGARRVLRRVEPRHGRRARASRRSTSSPSARSADSTRLSARATERPVRLCAIEPSQQGAVTPLVLVLARVNVRRRREPHSASHLRRRVLVTRAVPDEDRARASVLRALGLAVAASS